jgi:hypothetical protein
MEQFKLSIVYYSIQKRMAHAIFTSNYSSHLMLSGKLQHDKTIIHHVQIINYASYGMTILQFIPLRIAENAKLSFQFLKVKNIIGKFL